MSKTKLLLVASSFFPTHGGAELRFLRYLPLLQEFDFNVEIISGTPKLKKFSQQDVDSEWRSAKDGALVSTKEIAGANLFQYKLPESGALKRAKILLEQVIARCKCSESKPDVIQILLPLPSKTIPLLRQIHQAQVPIVFSYALAHTFSQNYIFKYLQLSKIRKVYRHYDQIIVASNELKSLLQKITPEVPVSIIPNGVDVDFFRPLNDQDSKKILRNSLGLPQNAKIIVSVGAVHPRKGTHLLVEAWSKLVRSNENLHLLIVGPRYDQQRSELKQYNQQIEQAIEASRNKENIHFAGQVENVIEYLQVADLFVFTSKKEGMPNAVLEAMATELPIVLTPFIGLSDDFGRPGEHYLMAQPSSHAVADAIDSVMNNSSLATTLKENARNWIAETMQLKNSVRMHAELYRSLT